MIIIINYSFAIKNNDTIKRFVQLFCISTSVYEQGAPKKLLSQRCMHIIFFPKLYYPSLFLYDFMLSWWCIRMPIPTSPATPPLQTSLLHNWRYTVNRHSHRLQDESTPWKRTAHLLSILPILWLLSF